jgi:hypothetical protein
MAYRNPSRAAPRAFVQLPPDVGDLVDKLAGENELSRKAMAVILIRAGIKAWKGKKNGRRQIAS